MPTINQMVRKGRKNKKVKSKAPALQYTLNSYKQRRVRQEPEPGDLTQIGHRRIPPAVAGDRERP